MKKLVVALAAAWLLSACASSRTTLDLDGLGDPEEVAARSLLANPQVVALVGDEARIVERTAGQLGASHVPLLGDTRLPGTSHAMRGERYRIVGSSGMAYLDVRAEQRNNGRWKVAKWSVMSQEEHDRLSAEGAMPPP